MKQHLVAGIMSGTSLDGIDTALVEIAGSGSSAKVKLIAFTSLPFPRKVRQQLLRNSDPVTSRVDEITRLNMLLPVLYADAIRLLARKARIRVHDIALIGSHGQTIHHLPDPEVVGGKSVRSTLQIGDVSALATLTGIPAVGNFRTADMALGGEGAPLVPYFDWVAFRSRSKNRVLLNIGGIANVTILPGGSSLEDVVAFDTGPGNMVIDALTVEFFGKRFDRDGRIAAKGMIINELLAWMMRHPYFKRTPPKSTGREEFGAAFVAQVLRRSEHYDREDVIATASWLTATSVHDAVKRFSKLSSDEMIVSGGGARNRYIMEGLQQLFRGVVILRSDDFGIPSAAKEAMCFALLAHETMLGNPTNLPRVTGARKTAVLGTIALP